MIKQLIQNNKLLSKFGAKASDSKKTYKALLGIGGNIGDVPRRFNHLFIYLKKSPFVEIIETAPILKNPPFGYLEQDDFHNSLIYIRTSLRPKALLRYILHTEKRFGRKRSFANAPRTLDIDMIFYEYEKIKSPRLTIPHPAWKQRESVTIPLSYMSKVRINERKNFSGYEWRS